MKIMKTLMNGNVCNLVASSTKQTLKSKKDWHPLTKKALTILLKEIWRLNHRIKNKVKTLAHLWIFEDYYHESNQLSHKMLIITLKMTWKNKVQILLWTPIAIKFIEKLWVISRFIKIDQLSHIISSNLL